MRVFRLNFKDAVKRYVIKSAVLIGFLASTNSMVHGSSAKYTNKPGIRKCVLKGTVVLERTKEHVPLSYGDIRQTKEYPIEIYLDVPKLQNKNVRQEHNPLFGHSGSHWHILCNEKGEPVNDANGRCWPAFLCKEEGILTTPYYLSESLGIAEYHIAKDSQNNKASVNITLYPTKQFNPHGSSADEWSQNSIVLQIPYDTLVNRLNGTSSDDTSTHSSVSDPWMVKFDDEDEQDIESLLGIKPPAYNDIPCLMVSQHSTSKFFSLQGIRDIKITDVTRTGFQGCRRPAKLSANMVEDLAKIKPDFAKTSVPLSMIIILNALIKSRMNDDLGDSAMDDSTGEIGSMSGENSDMSAPLLGRTKKKVINGDYASRIEELNIDDTVREKLRDVANSLKGMHTHQSEYSVTKNYLEYVLNLPWGENISIPYSDPDFMERVKQQLDADHYGLDRVKEKIRQYISVKTLRASRNLDAKSKQPILCFVGRPGIGKTSMAQSIAKCMGIPFQRIALGGVDNESVVRGHSRTYVAAKAGRIMDAIKQIGVTNGVIVLDEIDKLGENRGGSPADALLEVLDPEQNTSFVDHYVDIPFDLSETFFICTANNLGGIPRALRDRMQVIELEGYTGNEKFHIAKNHLFGKSLDEVGIYKDEVEFTDNAFKLIIEGYTREAGVRNLKREIYNVLAKAGDEILRGAITPIRIDEQKVHEYLLAPRYVDTVVAERPMTQGLSIGMYYCEIGGGILFIEASYMPTDKDFQLESTGQLGDVMKESARIACRYLRANADKYGVDPQKLEKGNLHIHVLDGSTPKEGPSAGLAMFTAIVSELLGKQIKPNLAMTGEITLHGRAGVIGGVKQKITFAYDAGVREVILPVANKKDYYEEVSPEIQSEMTAHFVNNAEEVFNIVFDVPAASGEAKTEDMVQDDECVASNVEEKAHETYASKAKRLIEVTRVLRSRRNGNFRNSYDAKYKEASASSPVIECIDDESLTPNVEGGDVDSVMPDVASGDADSVASDLDSGDIKQSASAKKKRRIEYLY